MSDKPINLVYLMRRVAGGMQTHLLDLVSRLDRQKYRIIVISPDNISLQTELEKLAVSFIEMDIDDGLRPLKDWRTAGRLKKILIRLKPDILHIHGNKSALVGRLAARRLEIPAVLVTVHNFLIYQEANVFFRLPASWLERRLARYTDCLIAVSESLKNGLVEIEGLPADKIVTIPNGVDAPSGNIIYDTAAFRKKLGIAADDFLIASVGRLVTMKGHEVLLKTAAILAKESPQIKVAIAGDGPLRDELLSMRERLGLKEKVSFLGFLPDTKELLAAADLFVLPSLKEPFGIVILEAMAAGVPIVATRAGGVPEIIRKGCGVLVEPGDAGELAEAIAGLIGDERRCLEMAASAHRRLLGEYSVEKMVAGTESIYEACLERKKYAARA